MSTQPDYVTAYLDRFAKAVLVAREKGAKFNAVAAAAQGALESGWGRSELAVRCNNLFGVKGGSQWSGPTWDQWTWEYGTIPTSSPSAAGTMGSVSGYYRTMARWRSYPSYNEAIVDYAAIINKLAWYEHALPHADPPAGDGNAVLWLAGLMWPGLPRWATAPPATYVADVVAIFPMIGDLQARIAAVTPA